MASQWYVAHTKSQGEYLAADGLERAGMEVFFPRIPTPWPRQGHLDAPLFPGYLFIRHEQEPRGLPSLGKVPQVLGLVRFGDVAPPVPDHVITELKQRVQTTHKVCELEARFVPGQRVRLVSDVLDSLVQVVNEPETPQGRSRVLLEFLGRTVVAQVPRENLWPVEAYTPATKAVSRIPRRTRGRGRWVHGCGPRSQMSVSDPHHRWDNEHPSS